jgi:hypothetical protein
MKKSNIDCLKEWIDKSIIAVRPNRKQRRMLMYFELKNKKRN